MSKFILLACTVFSFLISCKTIAQTNTKQQVLLGSIGFEKKNILKKEFSATAIPSYKNPLKVSVIVSPFNKHTFKVFTKAKAVQAANVNVTYIDSIKSKPNYIKLYIADKVEVIEALNNEENTSVKKYLSYNKYANIITSISLALNKKNLEAVIKADAIFLVESGLKTYALQLYSNGVKTQTIQFNQGVVFAFKGSNCCWQANKRHKLDIVDLVSEFNRCPNKTYRSAKRVESKINSSNY